MSASSQTEFVTDEFETQVTDEDIRSVLDTLNNCIRDLHSRIRDDETLENLLSPEGGQYQLRSGMSTASQDPEPLTQEAIIEPVLSELGYDNLISEVSGASPRREMVADYSFSVEDSGISSDQLLIEAEPMNKPLEGRGHGIDQVERWLGQREFQSDFGFATDGLRWAFIRYDPDSYSHDRLADISLKPVFLQLFYNQTGNQYDPIDVLDEDEMSLLRDFLRSFSHSNFLSIAIDVHDVIRRTQESISDEFYEEYIRIVFGVRGTEDRSPRSLVGDGVIAPPEATGEDTRLFAVKVMNRLIFVKFLEDKGLVDPDLLSDLRDTYGDGAGHTSSLYKSFIEPLFFEVMNWKPEERSKHVANVGFFQGIPYLNGGLFRPSLGEEGLDEREFDVENSVLFEVVDLLESYEFSAGGGPTDLDPSVLGNVFEKTINYLTTDPGDKNKELGAFFTPKEITRFCAEETVRPALLERLQNHLLHERGWSEEEVNYESVYELINSLPDQTSLVTELLSEVVDDFRVIDPACGSGHFLTSVLEEIVAIRVAMYRQIGWNTTEHRLKKETVQNNIYGVDIVGPAVEIAKLRLWLSVIGEVAQNEIEDLSEGELALPNIAFNLRTGNSLIGFTGFPETTEDGDGYRLGAFEEDSVRRRYNEIIQEIQLYERKGWQAKPEEAETHRKNAFELIEQARVDLIGDLHQEFKAVGLDVSQEEVAAFDPFHWVLEFAEVYSDGGFDVIVGNPPWDRIKPLRDDYFSRFEPTFRTMMPEEKDATQERLLEDNEVAEGWEDYHRRMELQAEYFKNGYELQKPKIDGRSKPNPNDLSALFLERVFNLGRDDSYIAQVLPAVIWTGAMAKDLRHHMLDETEIKKLPIFENLGIFDNIHHQYKFGVVVLKNGGHTNELVTSYRRGTVDILKDFENLGIKVSREVLAKYSPESLIFPQIESTQKRDVLETMIQMPPLGDEENDTWYMIPYQGLRRTNIKDKFVDQAEADYPIYGGRNIYQFTHTDDIFEDIEPPQFWSVDEETDPEKSAMLRMKEKTQRDLKKAIYEEFDGSGSQKQFVNELLEEHRGSPLKLDDVRLDCTEYRIVVRDITNATNERTVIATVLPKGFMVHNTLRSIRNFSIEPFEEGLSNELLHEFYKPIFTDDELFVALGLINSLPFDYIMRTKVDTHIVTYKFKETQVPRLTSGDDWFEYIWTRSARLCCYGEEFGEMRDRLDGIEPVTDKELRRKLQAEIDAAAFHAYGLEQSEVEFVLDDFHKVSSPRLMDEEYFELVRDTYLELGTNAPTPNQ